jgi:hypothetical protein
VGRVASGKVSGSASSDWDASPAPPGLGRRLTPARLFRLLAVLVGVAVLVRLLAVAEIDRVRTLLGGLGPRLAWLLLPFPVGITLEALGWRSILRGMGARVRLWPLLRIRLGTEVVTRGMPGGTVASEVTKPLLLERTEGVPFPMGAASAATKKALVMLTQAPYLALAFLGAGALAAGARATGHPGLAVLLGWPLLLSAFAVAVFAVFLCLTLGQGKAAGWLFDLLRRIPLARVRAWLTVREAAFRALDRDGRVFFAGGARSLLAPCRYFFVEWLAEAADTWVLAHLLGIPLDFASAIAFEGVTSFWRSTAFFLPAGLGLQDAFHVGLVQATGVADPLTLGAAFLLTKRLKEAFWMFAGSWFLSTRAKIGTSAGQ